MNANGEEEATNIETFSVRNCRFKKLQWPNLAGPHLGGIAQSWDPQAHNHGAYVGIAVGAKLDGAYVGIAVGAKLEGAYVGIAVGAKLEGAYVGIAVGAKLEGAYVGIPVGTSVFVGLGVGRTDGPFV